MESQRQARTVRGRWIVWMPFVGAATVIAAFAAHGASVYDSLPDTIATHWGPGGAPDDWDRKSFGTVFMSLLVGGGMTLMLAFVSALIPAMSPPLQDPSDWARHRREGIERGTIAALGLTSFLLSLLVGYVSLLGWRQVESFPGWPVAVFMVALFASMGLAYRASARWARSRAAADGAEPTQDESAEDARWLAGGILNDPNEPAVWVPKREGAGYGLTVNVGHRKGKLVVAGFLLVAVGLPVILGTALG